MPGNSRCDMSRASPNYLLMSFGNFVDLASAPLKLQRAEVLLCSGRAIACAST